MKQKDAKRWLGVSRKSCSLSVGVLGLSAAMLPGAELLLNGPTTDLAVTSNDTVWYDSSNTNVAVSLSTINGASIGTGFLPGWAHTANSFLKYGGDQVSEISLAEKIVGNANFTTTTASSCYYDNLATTTVAANQTVGLLESTRDVLISNAATLDVAKGGLMFHNSSHWVKVGTGSGNLTSSSGLLNLAVHGTSTDHRVDTVVIKNFNGTTPLKVLKSGPGSLSLAAANTYTGGTQVNGGKLRITNSNGLGASGNAVRVSGLNSQVSLLAGTYTYPFTIEGLGYPEGTVQRGALRFEGSSRINGNLVMTGEARIAANGGTTNVINGTLTGSSPLSFGLLSDAVATSGGTIVLAGSAAGQTGQVRVYSGRLDLQVATGGDLAVYSGAGLGGEGTVAGNFEIGGGTASRLVVDGSTAGALAIAGTADVTFGTTDIEVQGFPAAPATSFTAMTYGSLVGDASSFTASSIRGGVVTDDSTNKRIVVSYSPATLNWTGSANANWTSNADLNFESGAPDRFYSGDHVRFTEAATVKTLSIVGTVTPASVTFDHSSDYVVNGTGTGIIGSTGITKLGTGMLTLSGQLNAYTGLVSVQQGRLKLGLYEALGNSSGVSIGSGGQLDYNGMLPTLVGKSYDFTISGSGPDGNGAITNSSATFLYERAGIRNLTLAGNAAIGGNAGRIDIGASPFTGNVNGNGYTLTKVGSSTVNFRLNAANSPINFVIEGGRAFAENTNNAFGGTTGTIRVKNGARAGTWAVRTIATPVFIEAGGGLYNEGGGKGTWSGLITLEGDATIEANTALDVTGVVTGAFSITKTGTQQAYLALPQYGGNTVVSGGVLSLGAATLANSSTVTIGTAAGTKLNLAYTGDDTVAGLVFGAIAQAPGRYGSTASNADIKDDTHFSGTGVLNVVAPVTPYESWQIANGIVGAGGNVDSDDDGISNGVEFVLGGDPSGPNSDSNALLPMLGGDTDYLEVRYRRTSESVSYAPVIQYGSNLSSWTVAQAGVNGVTIQQESNFFGTGVDRVTVRIPRSLAVGGKLFTRLQVSVP